MRKGTVVACRAASDAKELARYMAQFRSGIAIFIL